MTHSILSVVGARPQFVKAAAVSRAVSNSSVLTGIMVHTGQHCGASMSAVFFDELGIPEPAHRLDIHGGSHGEMVGRMLPALERIMTESRPSLVIVYGDTNTTLAAALAAAKLGVPLAHVEAGMRSYNRRMPEEVNRVVTDHVSELLLCSTRAAVDNLTREGLGERVHHVGDVMYDASLFSAEMAAERIHVRDTLELPPEPYAVATVHRAENTDDAHALARVLDWLRERALTQTVVLPLHPRTARAASRHGLAFDGIAICEPLGYLDMAQLVAGAVAVYTDSGGLQKEAYFHGVPCVTLRSETEWVETISCGWNRLWTQDAFAPRRQIDEYGKGDAAARIVALLEEHLTP